MAESGFDFKKFVDDSIQVLKNPKEFYSSMSKTGGLGEPIIKALIYGLISGIIALIWSVLGLQIAFIGPVKALILAVIFALIGLFIGAIIILIISAICGGSTDFENNVRVTAAAMVLMPVNTLLAVFGEIHVYVGSIITLVLVLYGIWLMYNALTASLQAKETPAKIISGLLALLFLIIIIAGFGAQKTAENYGEQYQKQLEEATKGQSEETKKALEQIKKAAEEMEKQNQ